MNILGTVAVMQGNLGTLFLLLLCCFYQPYVGKLRYVPKSIPAVVYAVVLTAMFYFLTGYVLKKKRYV
jgi:ABC-type multidrug transport system permease subunit